jgi:hypothetical protein
VTAPFSATTRAARVEYLPTEPQSFPATQVHDGDTGAAETSDAARTGAPWVCGILSAIGKGLQVIV